MKTVGEQQSQATSQQDPQQDQKDETSQAVQQANNDEAAAEKDINAVNGKNVFLLHRGYES